MASSVLADWLTHLSDLIVLSNGTTVGPLLDLLRVVCLVCGGGTATMSIQPSWVTVGTSECNWGSQPQSGTNTDDHCYPPAHCLSDCGNESGLCRPPSTPASLQISSRLSPQPLDLSNKVTLGSHQGPTEDHVKLLHLLQCGQGRERWGLAAIWGSRRRGVWRGQCHTKGGQEGKISHPWSIRQRTLFFGRWGGVYYGAVNK